MAHLLEAYDDLNSIVVALYDAMYVVFLHESLLILKVMVDIRKYFENEYL